MIDALFSFDKLLFHFCNETIANPIFDAVMPPLTDWNKSYIGIGIFAMLWILLMWRGGKKGRIVGILIVPLIFISDQLSSSILKTIFARPRPCFLVNGIPMVEHLRVLVPCGSGYSFPSSHAVNNFALAAFLSYHYKRWAWIFYLYGSVMAFSRVVVGVHYPSDVVGGAIVGVACSIVMVFIWNVVARQYPVLAIDHSSSSMLKQNE